MNGIGRKAMASALVAAALLTAPAQAQTQAPSISVLTSCAGAVAAHANIDVLTHPRGASGDWANVLGRILARMNTMEGIEGMTGRYAASAARSHWAEQPAAEREAAATQCRQRFGS
ncbi:MAG: hypothetical protein H7124_13945 [Phycisphaerales bacterium]|nr:hypothetical protein [Hyphomonadaceae bacterium]